MIQAILLLVIQYYLILPTESPLTMGLRYRGAQFFSVYTLTVIFLLSTSGSSALGEDDCFIINRTAHTGSIHLPYYEEMNLTCFQFQLSGMENPVFFRIHANMTNTNVTKISVYNVNNTGGLGVASERTFTNPAADYWDYVAVAFGRKPVADPKEEVARVVVTLSSPLTYNAFSLIASYTNFTCKVCYPTLPPLIQNPDYQLGGNTKYKFSCSVSVDYADIDSTSASSIAFSQFRFTSPAALVVDSSSTAAPVTYSGTNLPPDAILESVAENVLTLHMSIDPSNNDSFSFSAESTTEGCTMKMLVNSTGLMVSSPGFTNGQYPNNLNCKILLYAENNTRLELNLTQLTLAQRDQVDLIDGGASASNSTSTIASIALSPINGYSDRGTAMVSSGPVVLVRFITGNSGTAEGFSFFVSEIDMGGRYYTPSKIHYAPGWAEFKSSTDIVMQATENTLVVFIPDTTSGIIMSVDSSLKCYDGGSTNNSLIADYRPDLLKFPTYSTGSKMLCVAYGFGDSNVFDSDIRSATTSMGQFSHTAADSFYLNRLVGQAGEATSRFNWVIQPTGTENAVIELGIYKLNLPTSGANVTVKVQDLKGVVYAPITQNTFLPYIVRSATNRGLRVSLDIVPMASSKIIPSLLSFSAAYEPDTFITNVTKVNGTLLSPGWPQGTPQNTQKTWQFSLSPQKSLRLTFAAMFELTNGSTLDVGITSGNSIYYSHIVGPLFTAPPGLVINNTKTDEILYISVNLHTTTQATVSGIEIYYMILAGGYNSILGKTPQKISVPAGITSDYVASWILSVEKTNKDGLLQRVSGTVSFEPTTTTTLELRDGANADSPLIYSGSLPSSYSESLSSSLTVKSPVSSFTYITTSDSLYISYRFVKEGDTTASPLVVTAVIDVCADSSQCELLSNEKVCLPSSWKCDGIFQCKNGQDESDCDEPTTTPIPERPKTPGWVIFLCIFGGLIIGVAVTLLIICVKKQWCGRSAELSDPVPTLALGPNQEH